MRISPTAIVILVGSVAAIPPNIMPVLSAELVRQYSLSDAQLGYFVAAGTLAGAIASLSAPYWVSRVRLQWLILGSLLLYACAIHALPVAPNVSLLYALQFLLGGCLVVISSICSSVLLRRPNPARTMSLKISSDVVIASAFLFLLPGGQSSGCNCFHVLEWRPGNLRVKCLCLQFSPPCFHFQKLN